MSRQHEQAIRMMLEGAKLYASAHKRELESTIGEDGVLGEHWNEILDGIHGLLNGPTGAIVCADMSRAIRAAQKVHGFRCTKCGEPCEAGRCVACGCVA